MDYKAKSIELMNRAVKEELTAVHQYMYFHFHLSDMGYVTLSKLFHRISITEMIHVEELAERILYLGGDVEMNLAKPVKPIKEVKEMLQYAAELETTSIDEYNEWAAATGGLKDSATKRLFEELVVTEEEHQDMFLTIYDNFKKFGDNYLLSLQAQEYTGGAAVGKIEDE